MHPRDTFARDGPGAYPTWPVSPVVRRKAQHLGESGRRWLRNLPAFVGLLEREWSITVVRDNGIIAGGTASIVLPARTAGGRDAVLKLAIPAPDFAGQARTLVNAEGRGYVRVLAADLDRCALLLEPLGPSMDAQGLAPGPAIDALCTTLIQAWRVPRPAGATVPPGQDKASGLHELVSQLWPEVGRPCSVRVHDRALRYADRRAAAFDLDRCVVVHGDPHPGNALRVSQPRSGAESGYVFVDPDGFLAEPEYDLGVVLRDWSPQLLAAGDGAGLLRGWCTHLAGRTVRDPQAIWEWAFLERVSSGLYLMKVGADELGRRFLAAAEMLVP